ncbi:hypothetical protein T552_01088 [Pneumocystis carinii B80]|uniref:non-specific serine/threonine protein kinase n=1 Tax=Pneumocystis carinii (strain B80) TaxID=1408658 RepID=A0A0W4ZND4_PNEC8|nr:hypothetical protein T552_01088 [Pneumocystis carinii B80]KTW29884.1 hypothetical protein T552_01088 [Pneumocystis carinii B80]
MATDNKKLSVYHLGDCLGKGAFGAVYRGLNPNTGETVAVKQIKLHNIPKTELKVIMMEIDLLKNLNHPNIVKYHGFFKTADALNIVLEYCENGSLQSICKTFGKFPENLVAVYITQVLHGLLYLHDQGVIHRDIKGANILTTKEGFVKLADFGVATRTSSLSDFTVVGSPYWMAPEVIELSGATTASDIWSVGCTVIELLEGKPPYHKLDQMPALFRIVNDEHPPLPEGSSPVTRDFLMQCFQKDPNLRVSAKKLLKHPWLVKQGRLYDKIVPQSTAKYDDVIKSVQQWNAALKSPDIGTIQKSSVYSTQPFKSTDFYFSANETKELTLKHVSEINKLKTEAFRSPDDSITSNWDNDFITDISPSKLVLSDSHYKATGLNNRVLSKNATEIPYRFKEISSKSLDDWDKDFEGGLKLGNFQKLKISANEDIEDNMKTIRPLKNIKYNDSNNMSPFNTKLQLSDKCSKDISSFHYEVTEDYSDLVPENEYSFAQKVDQYKRDNLTKLRLFHPNDIKMLSQSSHPLKKSPFFQNSSILTTGNTSFNAANCSTEISQYIEHDDDETDYSNIFSHLSRRDEQGDLSNSDTLMLNTKLSYNSWFCDDASDEDDLFLQINEGFEEMDLDANIAREQQARTAERVISIVDSLKVDQDESSLITRCSDLMSILSESSDFKANVIAASGLLPILEILDVCQRRDLILQLLKIVNLVMDGNIEAQENFCFIGGIPVITKFASKKYSYDIRIEAAFFIKMLCHSSGIVLQMFLSCRGLNVLVEFLEEDYEVQKDLVWIGIDGVWSIFEAQGSSPKSDFCRIFAKSGIMDPLSLALHHVLNEEQTELNKMCGERIVKIFLLFSQADNTVKELITTRGVIRRILKDLSKMPLSLLINMLKFVKNLSTVPATLDTLQNANTIEILTEILASHEGASNSKDIYNQVLNTMYNLCRLSKSRQEEAALSGVVPLLQNIVQKVPILKEFALPILCDLAHASKVCRKVLWQNGGLDFYLSLLNDPYWQANALDAILVWFQDDSGKLEEYLLRPSSISAIIEAFSTAMANSFENLLECLHKLLRLSQRIACALVQPKFFEKLARRLQYQKPIVRLNLLRVLRSICNAHPSKQALITQYGLYDIIEKLSQQDTAVLVRELAKDIMSQTWMDNSESSKSSNSYNSECSNQQVSTVWFDANDRLVYDRLDELSSSRCIFDNDIVCKTSKTEVHRRHNIQKRY